MPWAGGVYTRGYPSWSNDAASNLPISSTKFDTEDNDFAAGLNNCLTKDGLSTPNAAMTWGLTSAQILALTRGSDGTVFSVARTGGSTNPGLQLQVTDTGGATLNLTTAQTLGLAIQGTTALSVNSNRQVLIAAPASGVALAITGIANAVAASITDGTETLQFTSDASHNFNIGVAGAHTLGLFTSGSASPRIVLGATGNITANAPTAGTTLAINVLNAAAGVTVTDGTTTGELAINASHQFLLGTTSNHGIGLVVNGGTPSLAISNAGNVTIPAPSSGIPLGITMTASGATPGQQWTDGTAIAGLFMNSNLQLGLTTAHSFNFLTNNLARFQIVSAGNATFLAPDSGDNVQINVLAGGHRALIIAAPNSGGDGRCVMQFQALLTTTKLYDIGVDTSGGTAKSWDVRDITTGPVRLSIASAGTLSAYGPTQAGLVDLTPDKGTFTITYTGMTVATTGTAVWARIGNLVLLFLPAATGTSNATTMTATGIPAAINPTRTQAMPFLPAQIAEDNGVAINLGVTVNTNNTITFGNGSTGGAFTNSGAKGIVNPATIAYLLN